MPSYLGFTVPTADERWMVADTLTCSWGMACVSVDMLKLCLVVMHMDTQMHMSTLGLPVHLAYSEIQRCFQQALTGGTEDTPYVTGC